MSTLTRQANGTVGEVPHNFTPMGDGTTAGRVWDGWRREDEGEKVQALAMEFIERLFSQDDCPTFEELDTDKSGSINMAELREGLKAHGEILTEFQLRAVMEVADNDGDGTIDPTEFHDVGYTVRQINAMTKRKAARAQKLAEAEATIKSAAKKKAEVEESSRAVAADADAESEGVKVIAIFDFAGEERMDLKFHVGDTILVLSTESDLQWWSGHNTRSGEDGEFPASYALPCLDKPKVVVVKKAFRGQPQLGELTCELQDSILVVAAMKESEWAYGSCRGTRGVFPINRTTGV